MPARRGLLLTTDYLAQQCAAPRPYTTALSQVVPEELTTGDGQ
ncbi:hypothetical protein [Streptomyces atroolivaceus]